MENNRSNIILTKKKILSLICLIVFSLVFIFSCLSSILPIGNVLVHTFGYVTFPLFFILSIISLAKFLGLSYKNNKKATAYFLVILFSLFFTIQAVATYNELDKVVSFKSLKTFLDQLYSSNITLLGTCGALVSGLISMLLGAMGTIVTFVIILTLFTGILVDYNNYGRFEDDKIRKLESQKLRKKVYESDNQQTISGEPVLSFNTNEDISGEIEVDLESLNFENAQNGNGLDYTPTDVVGEVTESLAETEFEENSTGLNNNTDLEKYRQFMSDTFNNTTINQPPLNETGINYEQNEPQLNFDNTLEETNIHKVTENLEENIEEPNDFSTSISKILSRNEDDLKPTEPDDLPEVNFAPEVPSFEPKFESISNAGFEQPKFNPVQSSVNKIPVQNENIMPKRPPETVVIPKTANQTAMAGVRYNPPPLSLLKKPVPDTNDYTEEQNRKSRMLEDVLKSFNMPVKVVKIVRGPKITRFELDVPLGVSVKRIPNLESDIQRALSAKTLKIDSPIPGTPFVGVELENDTFTSVYERELFESPEFVNAKDPLPVAIGKDISGEIVVKSLAKMVHLLIAGSTGSGKSVFIHNIIMSLIFKYSPENLRLVLIDPKKVEFNIYNHLPHLITPEVVMGADKAINALKWCVKEMDRRYDMMSKAGYNNIEPYNKSELVKSKQFEHLPYIVIIVDELAEIMVANKKESEVCIQRITQLARACGMHLILATQRPSVDIISGVIKNNVPSRIAFSLQSGIDSKTILNAVGAEKLLGQGDMIFAPTGTSVTPRLQAAYATDEEIKAVIDYDIKNNTAIYDDSIDASFNAEQESPDDADADFSYGGDAKPPKEKVDDYFKTALKIVMMNGGASVSYLQRRLSIGYARAARIVDQMEEKGYIAQPNGSKLRKVVITPEQFKEEFGEDYNTF